MQETFHPSTSIPLIGVFVSLVYCSHFLVMPTVAVVLWIRNRPRFLIWMRMVIALAVAGVATYFLYPMAPPWLADSGGVFPGPAVGRYTSEGFDLIGLHMVGGMVSQGQYLVNPVAAMPSLHTAYGAVVVRTRGAAGSRSRRPSSVLVASTWWSWISLRSKPIREPAM